MRIPGILFALAVVLGIPFVLKPKENFLAKAEDSLVIITPNNEQIRYEFTRAFTEYYKNKTGRTIRIDWRMPGGTSDITRYLKGEYYAAFENFWRSQGREWDEEAAAGFDNPKSETEARKVFLSSDVGVGIDLFFGGGSYDFELQARAGRLVDCGIVASHPEWFRNDSLPAVVSGERFYDPQGRWIGTVLSSFGICYNLDSLKRLKVANPPTAWNDLTEPDYFQQAGLADPSKSGSAAKAFEMLIQQQMQKVVAEETETPAALEKGWVNGLRIIQQVSANARYFTDSASQVPIDVSQGDAAVGMCIDFYGRYQSESVKQGDFPSRLQYITPSGGSSIGVDPIGLLRGAPNRAAAVLFMEFVLSLEGQKLWDFKVGTPGGPMTYALRRLPVRKELYSPEFTVFRSDPDVFPYEDAKLFTYHPEWTASLFKPMGFIIRVMCLDCHDELVSAWRALIDARFPPQAMAKFSDLTAVNYFAARETIQPALGGPNNIQEVVLARTLGNQFRAQYREAERLAKEGK